MNKSMTGYGQAHFENDEYTITAEVKTLNSKYLDVSIRLPKTFNDKELEVRSLISDMLERGKISLNVEFLNKKGASIKVSLNEALFKRYYQMLKALSKEVGSDESDIFRICMQLPEVMETVSDDTHKEEEWLKVAQVIKQALQQCDSFRVKEGTVLTKTLRGGVKSIQANLEEVKKVDPERVERIKKRLGSHLNEFEVREELDVNRFEQEVIYYLEKLDISEEIVRLESHLQYFMEILESPRSMGKKMNFISQEMGREINTIGSKSNDALMQKLVVNMKEELEKIKEQQLNLI
jgi:uncharacterized protein (TIGR00255 family)